MVSRSEKFGEFIRRHREAREIGLRKMAEMIGVSPTYLSKVERDEFSPPAEDRVKAIAKIIECDADDLLARAGRVSSDLLKIIKQQPCGMADLVRSASGLDSPSLTALSNLARKEHRHGGKETTAASASGQLSRGKKRVEEG